MNVTRASRTYNVPQLYSDDRPMIVAISYPLDSDGNIPRDSAIGYCVAFPGGQIISGADLRTPAGREATPDEQYRALCSFFGYFGEHLSHGHFRYCSGPDDMDCPVRTYTHAQRVALEANYERFTMAELESQEMSGV